MDTNERGVGLNRSWWLSGGHIGATKGVTGSTVYCSVSFEWRRIVYVYDIHPNKIHVKGAVPRAT